MRKLPRFSIVRESTISAVNANFYIEKGFLVAESLFNLREINEIYKETIEIFRGNRGPIEGIHKITDDADPSEILANYNAIHFPHKLSPLLFKYVKHPKVTRILKTIISPNVKCMQSMLFVKGPGKPGQSWHQDEYYIPTRDRSLTGVWIALDDAFIDNGCLWVIPGSHQDGIIRKIIPYKNDEYREQFMCDLRPFLEEDSIPVEIPKGSVIFFNGYLLHRSLRNKTSSHYRLSLVSHYMSAESFLPWSWDGRIELKEDMRDIILVAGKDPYAYKGTENITYPYLRKEEKGYEEPKGKKN